MSYHRFSIVQGRAVVDKRVSNAQFRTLSALGMYADKDGWCFPSQAQVGDDLGKSRQMVNEDIAVLVECGYVEKYAIPTGKGAEVFMKYRLLFDPQFGPIPTGGVDSHGQGVSILPDSNDSINDSYNTRDVGSKPGIVKKDIIDGMLTLALPHEEKEKIATHAFENIFGFGTLPWHSSTAWDKLRKFVTKIHTASPTAFGDYVAWRGSKDGKYVAMSNKQIRTNPAMFIDTGWPEFTPAQTKKYEHPFLENL